MNDCLKLLLALPVILGLALLLATLGHAAYARRIPPSPKPGRGAGRQVLILDNGMANQNLSGGEGHPSWRRALAWAQALIVILVAPALWFPTLRPQLTVLALLFLALLWLALALAEGRLWPPSPYDVPLALLLVMAALSAFRSPVPELTLPKVTALILGLALYRALLDLAWDLPPHDPSGGLPSLWPALGAAFALALLFSLVGLIGGLRPSKVPWVGEYLARLPKLITSLPGTQFGLVSTNQLGGALLYVLPLALALLLAPWRLDSGPRSSLRGARWLAGLVALLLAATLLATQSRGAWAGMLAGLLLLLALLWPWGRWAVLLILFAAFLAWALVGPRLLLWLIQAFDRAHGLNTSVGMVSLAGRLEIWSRALACIWRSPWLGCGLGTFRALDPNVAAHASIFDVGIPHAHNIFLQVAYDLGLPGLSAYLALLFLAVHMGWVAYRRSQGLPRALAVGSLAALLAYHVYGLTDVVALGSKPGVLWWALLALIAALQRLVVWPASANLREFPNY